jgi:predicted N-acetyltransferase YhbS
VDVRPLLPDDVPAAARSAYATFEELDARLGTPAPPWDDAVRGWQERRVAHLQGTDPAGAWVAEDDGAVVGVALALRRGPLWFLSLLTVEPGRQGAGLGRRLLDAALATAAGAPAALIMASPDPRALHRYAAAGFALHPAYDARGEADRTALPAGLGVRDGNWAADADLVEDVVRSRRGAGLGPDVGALAGCGLLVAEDGADRGYALTSSGRVVGVGATDAALAHRLLLAALAASTGTVELGFVTADQPWAVDALLAARLPLKAGTSQCRRGALGPMSPYLPTGAYG